MSFDLKISCSKDIKELNIVFEDGSSSVQVVEKDKKPKPKAPKQEKTYNSSGRIEPTLDIDAEFGSVSQEVIALPEINTGDRTVNVAEELQNLDI